MRKFIFAIIILLGSVWLGLKIAQDPGLAYFTYRAWSVETPLWFAVVCLLLLLVVLYLIVRFFDSVDSSFYRWKNWLRWRRKNKSYSKTNRGLLELIECHWSAAENYLLEGIPQSDAPLINYLAAAKAAHERGAYDKRDSYLRRAHELAPKAEMAIGLTQAQLQLNQGQLEQALATLNHLRSITPLHPLVLRLLEKLYVRLADWKSLLKLIPSLRKANLLTTEQLAKLEEKTYQELIHSTVHKSFSLKDLTQVWQSIPRRLQKNPHLVYCYAKQLLLHPESLAEVEALINSAVKNRWDTNLVKLYGQFYTTDPKKQLNHAEKWLKSYPNQAALLLTLGRLSLNCQLWGKARHYFEDALKFEASAEAYFEYAKLLEQLGETQSALKNYHEGLAMAL